MVHVPINQVAIPCSSTFNPKKVQYHKLPPWDTPTVFHRKLEKYRFTLTFYEELLFSILPSIKKIIDFLFYPLQSPTLTSSSPTLILVFPTPKPDFLFYPLSFVITTSNYGNMASLVLCIPPMIHSLATISPNIPTSNKRYNRKGVSTHDDLFYSVNAYIF